MVHAFIFLVVAGQDAPPEGAELRFAAHADAVRAVAWSPDGRFLLTGSRDRALALWEATTGKRVRILEGHEGGVSSVAFSPDGKRMLSGGQDKSVILWEVSTGKEIRRMRGHSLWVVSVAFSPDGKRAASASLDRTAIVWDVEKGEKVAALDGHRDRVWAVAFTPDGKKVLTGSDDRTVSAWDAESGQAVERFVGPNEAALCVSITDAGDRFASGYNNGEVVLWDPAGKEASRSLKGHAGNGGNVHYVSFSPDGLVLASASRDESWILWEVASGRRLGRFFGHKGSIYAAAWSPGGGRLATAGEDGAVVVWNPWTRATRRAAELAKASKNAEAEARKKALKDLVLGLKTRDAEGLAEARELLREAADDAVAAILEAYDPALLGPVPPEERLTQLLKELDSEDFAVRVQAKKDLVALGRGILPWLKKKLSDPKDFSAEVRGSLADVEEQLKSAKGARDDGKERAVRILLDLPRNAIVEAALNRYAGGPEDSPATRLARRTLGR